MQSGRRYEFALVDATTLRALHIYYEPFVRSDYTVRVLGSQAIENYVGNRPGSAAGVFIRYKELHDLVPAHLQTRWPASDAQNSELGLRDRWVTIQWNDFE